MRSSSISALQYLVSKIHPPLPLNPRDSQKLLSLLNSSFRKHLDHEHGKNGRSNALVTDKHLHSILTSPLFDSREQIHRPIPALKYSRDICSPLQVVRYIATDSTEYFKTHVAAGLATMKTARMALTSRVKKLPRSGHVKTQDPMRTPQLGSMMLNWLWSSGEEQDLAFLRDKYFTRDLIRCLVSEGRQSHVWKWFLRLGPDYPKIGLVQAEAHITAPSMKAQGFLLGVLVASEITYGAGLNGALIIFEEAIKKLQAFDPPTNDYARCVLYGGGNVITRSLMESDANRDIDDQLFHHFIQSVEIWGKNDLKVRAHTSLIHPDSPDPYPALEYIRYSMKDSVASYLTNQRKNAVILCLKTAEVLLGRGDQSAADWVLKFLQTAFPREIGREEVETKSAAQESDKSDSTDSQTALGLHQLEALSFG